MSIVGEDYELSFTFLEGWSHFGFELKEIL